MLLNMNLSLISTLLTFLLYVRQTWMTQLILAISLRGVHLQSSFNPKGFCYSYAWSSLQFMKGLSFEWDLSPEKSMDSFLPMFSTGFSSFSVLLLFRIDHLLHLYPWFLMLFHLTQMRLSLSTHLLRCLSLETLLFIIRASILVDRHDPRERKFPWKL